MDDDYVLKYIPVMVNEVKQVVFGSPEMDEDGFEILATGDSKEVKSFEKLKNDKKFNEEIDKILHSYLTHQNYQDFKNQLVFYVSRKKSDIEWRGKIYNPPDRKRLKRQLSNIDKALSKVDFNTSFRQQYIEEISKQLKKQNPAMAQFDCFDAAEAIANFSENILPLMKHSARKAVLEIDGKRKPKKLTEQEASLKEKMARVLAAMLLKFFDLKPKNTTYIENPEILDALFILCCKSIGLKKVSVQSDHVQNAIKEINQRLRNNKASSAA